MKKKFLKITLKNSLLIASSFYVIGCDSDTQEVTPPASFTPYKAIDLANELSAIPAPTTKTWQAELERHKLNAKKLAASPRYYLDSNGELRLNQVSTLVSKNITIGNQSNQLITIDGKVFINGKRIYDVNMLKALAESTSFNSTVFPEIAAKFGVDPSPAEASQIGSKLTELYPGRPLKLNNVADLTQRQSFREVRTSKPNTGQFSVNGQTSGCSMPLFVTLDGAMVSGKPVAGNIAFKQKNQYFGVAYAGMGDADMFKPDHAEASAIYGLQFKSAFIEAQLGSFVDQANAPDKTTSGNRYQLTLGLDTPYVTPFVRALHRSTSTASETRVGPGLEFTRVMGSRESGTLSTRISTSILGTSDAQAIWYHSCNFDLSMNDATKISVSADIDSLSQSTIGINFSREQ